LSQLLTAENAAADRVIAYRSAMAECNFVALPFIATDDGMTHYRKEGHVGAVAFSRTGDPATGENSGVYSSSSIKPAIAAVEALADSWRGLRGVAKAFHLL
jgi:hypothetical protein